MYQCLSSNRRPTLRSPSSPNQQSLTYQQVIQSTMRVILAKKPLIYNWKPYRSCLLLSSALHYLILHPHHFRNLLHLIHCYFPHHENLRLPLLTLQTWRLDPNFPNFLIGSHLPMISSIIKLRKWWTFWVKVVVDDHHEVDVEVNDCAHEQQKKTLA